MSAFDGKAGPSRGLINSRLVTHTGSRTRFIQNRPSFSRCGGCAMSPRGTNRTGGAGVWWRLFL